MDREMCPVDVIAVCAASGEMRPLRIRIEDENRQLLKVNIEEVLQTQNIAHVGAEACIFLCRATVWDHPWVFELKYILQTHTWWMLRRS